MFHFSKSKEKSKIVSLIEKALTTNIPDGTKIENALPNMDITYTKEIVLELENIFKEMPK